MKVKMNLKQYCFSGLLVLQIALPSAAFAHAHLTQSNPAKNANLSTLPSSVILQFSEELEPAMSKIEITDLGSHKIVSESKLSSGEKGDEHVLQVIILKSEPILNDSKPHEFEVSWKAVSKDTHTMKGKYRFKVTPK